MSTELKSCSIDWENASIYDKHAENKRLSTFGLKYCNKCRCTLSVDAFNRNRYQASGYEPFCRTCSKALKAPRRTPQQDTLGRRRTRPLLRKALASGEIEKWPACAVPDCETTTVQAHHPDYSRPLDVVWLCQRHHTQLHKSFFSNVLKPVQFIRRGKQMVDAQQEQS